MAQERYSPDAPNHVLEINRDELRPRPRALDLVREESLKRPRFAEYRINRQRYSGMIVDAGPGIRRVVDRRVFLAPLPVAGTQRELQIVSTNVATVLCQATGLAEIVGGPGESVIAV